MHALGEASWPEARFRSSIVWVALGFGLLLALALVVYRPWDVKPFDIVDFSEFLPLLRHSRGFTDAISKLDDYYRGHGRFIPVWYSYLAGNWLLFGDSPLGWQVGYGVMMLGMLIALVAVLRRMQLDWFGIILVVPLFCFSSPATAAWLRFAGEPIGTIFLLTAIGTAIGYRSASLWFPRALLIAVAVLFMVLTKETFLVCVPLIVVLACCWSSEGTLRRPVGGIRLFVLCGLLGVVCLADAYVVLGIMAGANVDAYAAQYQVQKASLGRLLMMLVHLGLPFDVPGNGRLMLAPPNVIFAAVVSAGLGLAVRRGAGCQAFLRVGLAMLVVFSGAIIYLPWPRLEPFYELPYSLGVVWLLGWSLAELQWFPRVRAGMATAWVLGLMAMGLVAYGLARGVGARREVNYEVAELIARIPADSVFVATGYEPTQAWRNVGQTLRRYAAISHASETLPSVYDVSCADIRALFTKSYQSKSVLVDYVDWCGVIGEPMYQVVRRYSYFDWRLLGVQTRQLQVNFVLLP